MLAVAVVALHLEMARDVDWGYGCGGNCAIRNTGRSTVVVTADGAKATIVDEGWHKLTENHPGGGSVQETRWRTLWTGRARVGKDRLRFDLTGEASCRRTESVDENGEHRQLDSGCPRTPRTMRLDCEPAEVVAGDRPRKVWRCRASRLPPGTVQPWVFGIDETLDERLAGEPRPEASYTLR